MTIPSACISTCTSRLVTRRLQEEPKCGVPSATLPALPEVRVGSCNGLLTSCMSFVDPVKLLPLLVSPCPAGVLAEISFASLRQKQSRLVLGRKFRTACNSGTSREIATVRRVHGSVAALARTSIVVHLFAVQLPSHAVEHTIHRLPLSERHSFWRLLECAVYKVWGRDRLQSFSPCIHDFSLQPSLRRTAVRRTPTTAGRMQTRLAVERLRYCNRKQTLRRSTSQVLLLLMINLSVQVW